MYPTHSFLPNLRSSLPALTLCAVLATVSPARAWVTAAEPGARLTEIAPSPKGGVVVAGSLWDPSGASLLVASYDGNGARRWRALEPGEGFDQPAEATSLAVDAAGDVYVTGAAPVGSIIRRFAVLKYAGATGRLLWRRVVEHTDGREGMHGGLGETLALDGKGHVFVGGALTTSEIMCAAAARLDAATGRQQWLWTAKSLPVHALAVDRRGDVALTGPDLAVKLAGGTGRLLWSVSRSTTQVGAFGVPLGRSIAVDRRGDVVVGGELRSVENEARLFYVARLAGASGHVLWEFADRPQYALEAPPRITLDSCGDVYTGGRVGSTPAALRLRAGNGQPRWIRRPWSEDGERDGRVAVSDVAADKHGVYVSGAPGPQRFKVSAFTRAGAPRWSRDLGPGQALGLALGARGRLYLAGRLTPGNGQEPREVVVGLQTTTGASLR